ncbi:uncharacterized protein LOC142173791 [Nicotiana tabacum]|uniref:Uncharacterized protein LOC142173791 n=1 Tax=Nicotiana tabacum TaxID=4097 RepID=A0AC58TEA3_TOBAC
MKDGESVEEKFSRFSKIRGDLKSFGRHINSAEQVRKILRSLPTIWQPKVIALEYQDVDKISYDKLIGDLIAFEKTHLDRKIQDKKKNVVFKATVAELENEEEEEGGEQDENIAMLSRIVTSMMRKNMNSRRGKPNFKKGSVAPYIFVRRISNEADKNDGRFYECGKFGHIQADCPKLKKKPSRNMQKKKSFKTWSDEEEFDHEKIANICFMAMNENEDSGELGLMADNNDEEDDSRELGLMADEGTSEEHRKKNRKGKWYLDSACSRHMTGKVPLSSTCDVDEVYLIDELGYNLLSISQLCDNDYEVRFKKHD